MPAMSLLVILLSLSVASCAGVHDDCAHRIGLAGGHCSATAVGRYTLLTATHCLRDGALETVDGAPTRVVWSTQDGHDHTLIGQTTRFPRWIARIAQPVRGQPVWIVGNPGDEHEVYRHGYVAGSSMDGGKPATLYDMRIFFGDSGSGIFDGRGNLVGVITGIRGMTYDGVADTFALSYPLAFTPRQWRLAQ